MQEAAEPLTVMACLHNEQCVGAVLVQTSADVMGGTPVFFGSRVPVRTLVEYLQAGETIDDFLEGFPTVGRDMALEFLDAVERKASLLAS